MRSANESASCFHPQETSGKRGASTASFFKQVALGHHPGFHGVPQQHDMHRRCPGRMSGCRGPIADLETNSFSGEFAFHDCLRRSWALSGTAGGVLLLIISRQCWGGCQGLLGDCERTAGELWVDCQRLLGDRWRDCQGLLEDCGETVRDCWGECWGTAGELLETTLFFCYARCHVMLCHCV